LSARSDLAAIIKKHTECSNAAANAAIGAVLDAIVKGAKKEGRVSLPGFGTFTVIKRAARKGYNPQTGETIAIKARKTLRFKAAAELRDI
jgi:DNA-binding protein HU-beta